MRHQVTFISLSSLSRLLLVELIFCLHQMPSARALAQDGDGSCDVPTVEPLASTSLTCHFNKDLNETKTDFTVFLTIGVNPQKSQKVLACGWTSKNIKCSVSPGYQFNNAVSHKVTLEIPRASVLQIGTYTCVHNNMATDRSISCDFRLTLAGKTMCDIPSVRVNTSTSLTCYFPEDISRNEADYTVSVYHYKNSGNPDRVFSYLSMKKSQHATRGYVLDGDITDHLTLRFPNAVKEQEGKYSCIITGVDLAQNCSFTLASVVPVTSTCSIPSVQETEPAELTCAFSVDVNVTRKDFKVVRDGGAEIVSCKWRNNELNCSKYLGYEINETVTNHVVIKVAEASSKHKGRYVCQLINAEMNCFKPCDFNVLMTAKSTGEHGNTATIAFTIIGILLAVFLIAIVIKLRRRLLCFKMCRQKGNKPKNASSDNNGTKEEQQAIASKDET
ncbi:uncharacterized protein LOC112574805 isoform X2 [Pomacea canaliculata]|uniref:uncharacterized protein LOC112574805 isoform X2 n=1 Tax=Pomacea canaliculata TaxID=400727 RepID=UPI000D739F5F|nr:uncharacterized protein LOC112574805 isoform X2 [Pomacea canaliculata]